MTHGVHVSCSTAPQIAGIAAADLLPQKACLATLRHERLGDSPGCQLHSSVLRPQLVLQVCHADTFSRWFRPPTDPTAGAFTDRAAGFRWT